MRHKRILVGVLMQEWAIPSDATARFVLCEDARVVADETYVVPADDDTARRAARDLAKEHGLVLSRIQVDRRRLTDLGPELRGQGHGVLRGDDERRLQMPPILKEVG